MVIQDVQDVCFIHDGHKGILQAINDMKEDNQERYRELHCGQMLRAGGALGT
jgi:hypothetical protein